MQAENMEVPLKVRFLNSALPPLHFFLKLTGVPLDQRRDLTWKSRLISSWSIFLLVLCIQSNIYITTKRSPIFSGYFSSLQNVHNFVPGLANNMIRLSSLAVDTLVHITIVFNIGPRIELFLETLESVDYVLKRPNFFQIRRVSSMGLVYMFFMVRFLQCVMFFV